MLGLLFCWRKSSKCKKLLNLLRCRLQLSISKRFVILRQLREDIAQLLKISEHQRALALAEQLFKDQSLLEAYELLGNYCEFIIIRFRYISRYKDCPEDINEAISTLIFATAWCGDLPELQAIRKLFGERYGNRFAEVSDDLQPHNLINPEIREKLCIKFIPDDVKLKLIIGIAKEYIFTPWQIGYDNLMKIHIFQFSGHSNDHHLEGFIFKVEDYVPVLPFNSSESGKHIQDKPTDKKARKPYSQSSKNADSDENTDSEATTIFDPEEIKELEFNSSIQDNQYIEDKRIFLFSSFNHPLKEKDGSSILESCQDSEKVANTGNCSIIVHQDQKSKASPISSCGHVHPKLPDYDELAMKFKALKQQHLQRKNRYKRQVIHFLADDRFC